MTDNPLYRSSNISTKFQTDLLEILTAMNENFKRIGNKLSNINLKIPSRESMPLQTLASALVDKPVGSLTTTSSNSPYKIRQFRDTMQNPTYEDINNSIITNLETQNKNQPTTNLNAKRSYDLKPAENPYNLSSQNTAETHL